jgi:hypothetical protein
MRDLRRYAHDTNVRLIVGFLIILFLVGGGLIYAIWGWEAASLGIVCILIGLLPLGLTFLILWGIDWFVRKKENL